MAGESIGVTKRYPRRGSVSMKRGLSADSPRAPLKRATALCTLWSKSTNVSAGQSCARNSWRVTTKAPTSRWRPYGGGGSRSASSQRPAPLRTGDRQRSKPAGQFPPGCAYRGFSVARRPRSRASSRGSRPIGTRCRQLQPNRGCPSVQPLAIEPCQAACRRLKRIVWKAPEELLVQEQSVGGELLSARRATKKAGHSSSGVIPSFENAHLIKEIRHRGAHSRRAQRLV